MKAAGVARAVVALLVLAGCCSAVAPASTSTAGSAASVKATATTWLLSSPKQFKLGPPPAARSKQTRAELRELLRLQRSRSKVTRALVKKWNASAPVVAWTKIAQQAIVDYRPRPPVAARDLALLETAMSDATVAALDSRNAYLKHVRPAPWKLDHRLHPLVRERLRSTYASPEAAAAGAAETVLAYLFPGAPPTQFKQDADQAIRACLLAGLNYRSDLTGARQLGRQVGALALAHGNTDGSTNTTVAHPKPAGDADTFWSPTPPSFENPTGGPVGTWKPWVLPTPGALRHVLPGPSKYGSPAFMASVQEVVDVQAHLTERQKEIANFWNDGAGTFTPPGHWFEIASDLLKTYKLNEARTAQLFAALGVAEDDAAIAVWEAKFYWWAIRPVTAIRRLCDGATHFCTSAELAADPGRATYPNWLSYIITPSFPSYPSGHAGFSGAAARVIEHFMPGAQDTVDAFADEAAMSRLYGGIHYTEDNLDGLKLGRAVADLVLARLGRR